jgi:hypothetical protein
LTGSFSTTLTAANQLHILLQAIAGTAMNLSAAPATEKTISHETPPAPDVKAPWYTFEYSFVMQPGEAKRPIPPIK